MIRNQKVKVLILLEENEQNEWYMFSGQGISTAYGEDEPDYELSLLKEPNPDYNHEGR